MADSFQLDTKGTVGCGHVRACSVRCTKVPLRVHSSMLVLVALIVGNAVLNWDKGLDQFFASLVYATLGVFGTVLVHELGHVSVAICCGCEPSHVMLWPLGGIAVVSNFPLLNVQRVLIALAGPLTHAPMAMVWFALFHSALGCDFGRAELTHAELFSLVNWNCTIGKLNTCLDQSGLMHCMDRKEVNRTGGIAQCLGYTASYMESCSFGTGSSGALAMNCSSLTYNFDCFDTQSINNGECALPAISMLSMSDEYVHCSEQMVSTMDECVDSVCAFDVVRHQYRAPPSTPTFLLLLFVAMLELNVYM